MRPPTPTGRSLADHGGMSLFTVPEARSVLAELRPALDEFVALRADAAELAAAIQAGESSALGGVPELKAAEARIDELLTRIQQTGVGGEGLCAAAAAGLPGRAGRGRGPA